MLGGGGGGGSVQRKNVSVREQSSSPAVSV